jgi:hypothetical protein
MRKQSGTGNESPISILRQWESVVALPRNTSRWHFDPAVDPNVNGFALTHRFSPNSFS